MVLTELRTFSLEISAYYGVLTFINPGSDKTRFTGCIGTNYKY